MDYMYYQWNIRDIGEGYTDEDIAQLQTLINEELARVAEEALDDCHITVVSDEQFNGNMSIEFNHDEAIKQAIETAYERFIALAGRYDA